MGSNSSHSTAKALRLALISIACGGAMAMSAVAGAWMQSHFDDGRMSDARAGMLPATANVQQTEFIRESIGTLAERVGEVQARLIALEGLGRRVAEIAGVSYTDPEIQAGIEATLTDDTSLLLSRNWTAESLGRELDGLAAELGSSRERLQMLDAVLTERNGVKETVPSLTPVDAPYLSSSFGWRRHPVTGRHAMHEGLDFAAPKGAPILAASGGVVTEARYVPGYGKMVEINHGNGLVTRYAHASSISVKLGEVVTKGQQIGRVGSTGRSTGPHLHYEVRVADHPLDPTLFLADARPDTESAADMATAATAE